MNIKMDLYDLLGLYTKAAVSIAGELSNSFVQRFQKLFTIDDELRYNYFRDKGIAHAKARRYRQAVIIMKQLHQIDPEDADVALYLGISWMKVGERDEGVDLLESTHANYPDNVRVTTILSIAYMQGEDYDKAIPLLQALVGASPEDAKAYFRLGEACYKAEQSAQAAEALLKASELNPDDASIFKLLGSVYETLERDAMPWRCLNEQWILKKSNEFQIERSGLAKRLW